MIIRTATPKDAPGLREIFLHYIEKPVTFLYEMPSEEDIAWTVVDILRRYPYLVAEEEGKILGYAYAHPLREYVAYGWDAELTIYLHPDATGRGIGSRLYTTLMELLRLQGIKNAYGCVTTPNPASESLHRKMGFAYVGGFHQTGYKSGKWQDVVWFEKNLAPCDGPPDPVRPFPQLEEEEVAQALK